MGLSNPQKIDQKVPWDFGTGMVFVASISLLKIYPGTQTKVTASLGPPKMTAELGTPKKDAG